jgi:hypothetical protein
MAYVLSENDARGLRAMYRWWRAFRGGGNSPRRGQVLGAASVRTFRVAGSFGFGPDADDPLHKIPRVFGRRVLLDASDVDEMLYWANAPTWLSTEHLAAANAAWTTVDVVTAASWHDGYAILTEPPHRVRTAYFDATREQIYFAPFVDVWLDVAVPYEFRGVLESGDIYVIWDAGLFRWHCVAALCPAESS